MPITLDGTLGITTPSYGGADAAEYLVPVTAFKNRIINGAMVIDQRNNGASSQPSTGAYYSLDRWRGFYASAGKFTVQQNAGSVTPPAGFTNYLGVTSSSAYTLLAGDYFTVTHLIEGFNTADLGFGTANAKTITISFWVRSSLTGNFGGNISNASETRVYPFSYTISSANTWEYKTVTIPGDTTGTWLTTNGIGMEVNFSIGMGSTFNSGTAGAWTSSWQYPTGSTNLVATNGATFYITGVQLEVGTNATFFDARSYGTELQLCQRYFQVLARGANFYFANAYYYASTSIIGTVVLPVAMRTTPTSAIVSGTNFYTMYANSGGDGLNGFLIPYSNTQNLTFTNGTEASGTMGSAGGLFTENASSFIAVQAEL